MCSLSFSAIGRTVYAAHQHTKRELAQTVGRVVHAYNAARPIVFACAQRIRRERERERERERGAGRVSDLEQCAPEAGYIPKSISGHTRLLVHSRPSRIPC